MDYIKIDGNVKKYGVKYGVTELFEKMVNDFNHRLMVLEKKHIADVTKFYNSRGIAFTLEEGAPSVLALRIDAVMNNCAKLIMDKEESFENKTKESERTRYIRRFETVLEMTVGVLENETDNFIKLMETISKKELEQLFQQFDESINEMNHHQA